MIHRKKEIMFASALLNVFQRSLQSQISDIIFVDRKKAFFSIKTLFTIYKQTIYR